MSDTPANNSTTTPPAGTQPGLGGVIAGLFKQASFAVVAIVLLAAALGLNASVQFLQLHFKKEPVPLRQSFTEAFPEIIAGRWVQAVRDENLDPDRLNALGTNEFLFCNYIDAHALGRDAESVRDTFLNSDGKRKSVDEQRRVLYNLMNEGVHKRKNAIAVYMGLTYYTGKADTVAHIPERCYVGEGYDPVDPKSVPWQIAPGRTMQVRDIQFRSGLPNTPTANVAYFFHTNGHYTESSLDVRITLQNLLARYGYYAKMELMVPTEDKQAADAIRREFLAAALPYFEAALPDWSKYQNPAGGGK